MKHIPYASIETIYSRYKELQEQYENNYFKKFASIGLEQKFTDEILQNLLLITKNSKISWSDNLNLILGNGKDNNGENYVGKKLMELRTRFSKQNKEENVIYSDDIPNILISDSFMKRWMNMRINDMCKTVNIMSNYVKNKDNINDNLLTFEFVKQTLDKIYHPCSSLSERANNIVKPNPPSYFKIAVRNCMNFRAVEDDIISLFWTRIFIMLQIVILYTPGNILNISQTIASIELLMSKPTRCEEILDTEDNCIYSALFNVLLGLAKFNKDFGYTFYANDYDVDTAVAIILGSKNTEPKNKYPKFIPNHGILSDEEIEIERQQYEEDKNIWLKKREDIETRKNMTSTQIQQEDALFEMKKLQKMFPEEFNKTSSQNKTYIRATLRDQGHVEQKEGHEDDRETETDNDTDSNNDSNTDSDTDSDTDSEIEEWAKNIENELMNEQDKEAAISKQGERDEDVDGSIMSIVNMLREYVSNIEETKLKNEIEEAVQTIKDYSLPKKIKTNRINFFATLLSKAT